MQTLSEATATVMICCPECGDAVPVTVEVTVLGCDCGENHQSLSCVPNLLDVEMHAMMHMEDE